MPATIFDLGSLNPLVPKVQKKNPQARLQLTLLA